MKKILSVLTLFFLMSVILAEQAATVRPSTLNVRIRNNTTCDVIAQLSRGDKVQVISIDGKWAKIVAPEKANVFVSAQFFKDGVTTQNVHLRCGAGSNYQSYGIIPAGTRLSVLKEANNGWVKVKPLSTMFAYVAAEYLDIEKAAQPEETEQKVTQPTPKEEPKTPQEEPVKGVSMSEKYLEAFNPFKALLIEESAEKNFTATGKFTACSSSHPVIKYGIKNAASNTDYFLIGEFPKYFERQEVIVKGTKYNVRDWVLEVIVVDEIKVVEAK